MAPGFQRHELRERYDISKIEEDAWHAYSGAKTSEFLRRALSTRETNNHWLLNAGAGIYRLSIGEWREIAVDLFTAPLRCRDRAVCASIDRLPFKSASFGAVVCVGEVLAYCDPARVLKEFARVIIPKGILICDFASSRSLRHLFRPPSGRAADLVTVDYNDTPERTWIYDPDYIKSLLTTNDFAVETESGTHTWSALARRLGASNNTALKLERYLRWISLPRKWADLTTILAVRGANGS